MTEDELRKLIEKSQKDGYRALFMQYHRYVYSIVWRHLRTVGTHEDAEECTCDVFTKVFMHFSEINEGTLKGYIAAIAERTAVDRYRRLVSKGMTVSLDDESGEIWDGCDIAADFDKRETGRLIFEKIDSLGETDAALIIQKYYYGYRSEDIAKNMGMTHTAVRVRLSRAMKKLRKILRDENIG